MGGDRSGTSGIARRTLLYGYAVALVAGAGANALHVITTQHEEPRYGLIAPIIWEGSSWLSFALFLWIAWIAYRIAPLTVRPRWKLLVHVPAALLFSLAHVAGFIGVRQLAYRLWGAHYDFGSFLPHFSYELSKDAISYTLVLGTFALAEHLLGQQSLIKVPDRRPTFDIRDGTKLTRVRLDDVLAIASAGNYVEFVLKDGRRLLMRSPLSALELELGPRGFLRTHRSWLVNVPQVTALKPVGSGDYTVELGSINVPLSRRFPVALAKLRGG